MRPGFKWLQLLALSYALVLTSAELHAKPGVGGDFGLGIIVGEPNAGISMKYWNSQTTAIDGAISWSSSRWVSLHGDYLVHLPKLIQVQRGTMPVYYGIGGFIRSYFYTHAGVRVPVGIAYLLPSHPLEFFFELAANLGIAPGTEFFLGIGLGGRYYF
jgi:hypothetical protein